MQYALILTVIFYVWVAGMWHDYLRSGLECYATAHPEKMPRARWIKSQAVFLVWAILWPFAWCCLWVTEFLDWPELPYSE